jgi:ORF6N domain
MKLEVTNCDVQLQKTYPWINVRNMAKATLVPAERIEKGILLIRSHKVMLDSDLADLYKVSTKRLNEQVRRNVSRFPEDFMFQLTPEETEALRSQFATSKKGRAHDSTWTTALLDKLLADTGCKAGMTLDDRLRNQFFQQHCVRFHHRPFIWHVSDGRKDGFSCLVNYHKLNYKALENLTYAYLQDWITVQANDAKENRAGADLRLKAAQDLQEKLKLILHGEFFKDKGIGYDIFVRWKPIEEQPIGWNPDLNDGVRMNIRPFMTAEVLRKPPNIKWTKDRGKDPKSAPWYDVSRVIASTITT